MTKHYSAITCILYLIFPVLFFSGLPDDFADAAAMHEHKKTAEHSMHEHSVKATEVLVDLETRPAELVAGTRATLLFTIKDIDGKPMQDLTITHERLVHVMIIGADFSVFAHIHPDDLGPITPEMKKTAEFPVRYDFPKAGQYLIALDSAVKDVPFSEHLTLDVSGTPEMGGLKRDFSREKQFGDYRVSLSPSDSRITHGKKIVLTYTINKGKEPLKDLVPYLSAPMHLAIISADLVNFIHAHGEVPGTMSGGHHDHAHMSVPDKFGPDITAQIVFPSKGIYQIFSEIKHQGKVIPLSFMVEVE